MRGSRIGVCLALLAQLALVALCAGFQPTAAHAQAADVQVPPAGRDADWDIIRHSTEYLSFTAQGAAGAPDGGVPIRNLYQAYSQFRAAKRLSLKDAETINLILRQKGAEGSHVEDHGGQLRQQNVGFYENGAKVIDFPDWHTLPEKAKYLDALLARVSKSLMSRNQAIDAAAEAHIIIGKQQLFSDGNHRTARVVSDWILVRQGLPPASHFALDRASYELKLQVSMKGAQELFRAHMDRAVAASEVARRGGNNAPPRPVDTATSAGNHPPAANDNARPYGTADWTQDSPELQAPVAAPKLATRLEIQPAMRVAIAGGKALWLDKKGRIQSFEGSRSTRVSDLEDCVAIDGVADMLIALKSDGQLMRIERGATSPILPGRPVVSFRISNKGRLYAVTADGVVVQYDGQKWRSLQNLAGAWQATLDERSLFFVMNRDGQAFRRTSSGWQMVDNGTNSRQIEASNNRLFVLKMNGNLWRSGDMLTGGEWQPVDDGTGTIQVAVDGDDAYVLKDNGKVFRFDGATARWFPIENAARFVSIHVDHGGLYGLTATDQVLTLVNADRRSATRQAQFEALDAR